MVCLLIFCTQYPAAMGVLPNPRAFTSLWGKFARPEARHGAHAHMLNAGKSSAPTDAIVGTLMF
jgi:hypothetical protein